MPAFKIGVSDHCHRTLWKMLEFHLRRLIKWDQYHNIDLQDPCQALLEKK